MRKAASTQSKRASSCLWSPWALPLHLRAIRQCHWRKHKRRQLAPTPQNHLPPALSEQLPLRKPSGLSNSTITVDPTPDSAIRQTASLLHSTVYCHATHSWYVNGKLSDQPTRIPTIYFPKGRVILATIWAILSIPMANEKMRKKQELTSNNDASHLERSHQRT